jgi:hypothetical protein
MEFIENDGGDSIKRWIGLEHPGQYTFRDDLDTRVARNSRIHSHPIPNCRANTLFERLRHPVRNGAGSKPARLEHEETFAPHPGLLEQRERYNGALAGARRRLKYDGMVCCERARQLRQCLVDR